MTLKARASLLVTLLVVTAVSLIGTAHPGPATGAALTALVAAVAWLVMWAMMRPLSGLRAAVREMLRDPERRAAVALGTRDEIGLLAREVARLAARLAWRQRKQRRAEDALRESERRMATLIANLPGMVYRCRNDPDWSMEYVSDGALVLTGHAAAALQSGAVSFAGVIVAEDRERVWNEVQAALAQQRPFELQYRIRTAAGAEKWVWEQGRGVLSGEGELLCLEGFVTDITDRMRAERRRRKRVRELGAILENASVGIAFLRDGVIERCSAAFDEIFGYAPGELEGRPGAMIWPSAGDFTAIGREARPILRAGDRYETERLARRRNGEVFLAHVIGKAVVADDLSKGTIWIFEDVTEKKRTEARLFAEKERAQATLQAIGDAVIVTGVEGQVEFMNPVAETLTGCDLLSTIGAPVGQVLRLRGERASDSVQDPVSRVLAGGGLAVENQCVVLERLDGELRSIEYSAAPIRNREQEVDGVVIAFRDVTGQHEMARQVHWQACHDALTGLINRREFERRVEDALAQVPKGAQHAILFLDLDQFKVVNDTCGHAAGDELLRQLTLVLEPRVRQSDTLARLGGDEFGVLLQNCSLEQSARVAESLRQAVEDFHFAWQDRTFRVGVSIGGVAVDDPAKTLAQLMSAADGACYVAKDTGRNRVHMVAAEDDELQERHGQMQWVSRIHQALAEDRFRLWFQEIAPVAGGSDDGDHYELLVRMVDEQGAPVPPMAFIPAAERFHLMPAIDRWVVRTALAHFEASYGPGATRRLHTASINLSGASVSDPNFLEFVRAELAARRVEPRAICFEITETAAIANLTRATHFIAELKRLGCRFSLDDFGSGMSSFAYLKNLPVDYLKIDGGFVKDMHRDPIDRAMVEAIHRVGHVMGKATIAEFVENDEILALLAQIGVDYAQGYGVAKPRPLAELGASRAQPIQRPRLVAAA